MSMSDNELARALFPRPRDVVSQGMGGAPIVTTAYGHAVSDSESGTVTIVLDGEAGGVDAEIDVPTGARILEGDQVMVTVSGTSPVDAVAAGWGDAMGDKVDSVTNYFWHDTAGAHVATVEGDATTGQNVLIDSNSLDIRSGTDVLASFDADGLHLYDEQGNEFAYFTGSVVLLGGGTAQILMPYSLIESTASDFNHWVNWATTQGWKVESHSYESGSGNFAYIYANSEEHRWTLDENDGCTVYIEAANAAVQADGIPAAHVGVYTWLDDGTPANHASNVEISGGNIYITGENSTYNKTMDGFIQDLLGARGTVLFESANGTNSAFTIGDYDFADFDRVTIMYGKLDGNYGGYQSQTVYSPNGKRVVLSQSYAPVASAGTIIQINTSVWTLSGNTVTPNYNGRYANMYLSDGSIGGNQSGEGRMLIYRVVGYSTKTELDSSSGTYTAGDGISISGNVISADVTTQVLSDALDDYVPVVDTMSYADIQAILV